MKDKKNNSLSVDVKFCPNCHNVIFNSIELSQNENKKYVKCPHCNKIFEMKRLPQNYSKLFQLFYLFILVILIILRFTKVMTMKTFAIGVGMTIVAFFIDLFFSSSKKDIDKIDLEIADMGIYQNLKNSEDITFYPEENTDEEKNRQ